MILYSFDLLFISSELKRFSRACRFTPFSDPINLIYKSGGCGGCGGCGGRRTYRTYFPERANESTIKMTNIPKNVYNIKSSNIEFVL